jgi:hypothetical protein
MPGLEGVSSPGRLLTTHGAGHCGREGMAVHATIGLYDSRELADALATRQKDVEALISGVSGLRSYHLIRTENGCASITVCDDVAGTEESTRIAAEWIRDNLPDIRIGQPEIRSGEVLVRTGSEVPA